MDFFTTQPMSRNVRTPLLVEPTRKEVTLRRLAQEHGHLINDWLLHHGAVLFRGFSKCAVEDLETLTQSLSGTSMEYQFRSTPRHAVGNRVYTATEYPAEQEIPLHCENAYQKDWPLRVLFYCVQPAAIGGQTPIADLQRVTERIGTKLLDRFESYGVQYVRHYQPFVDLSWQTVFQTQDRDEVAQFCAKEGIEHAWLDADTLRTSQVCQGVAFHPELGSKVFFNQAHLFHVSSLGEELAASMIGLHGINRLPRNASYGNGEPIPVQDLESVRAAFRAESISFEWQPNDALLLDNMQIAHGRYSYGGQREVLVALLDPHSERAH